MRDAERMLVQLACLQLGIVPVDDPHQAVKDTLAKMAPDEARKTKRKFRKVWRQALHNKLGNKTERNKLRERRFIHRWLGHAPVAREVLHRRYLVLGWLLKQLEPMLKAAPLSSK